MDIQSQPNRRIGLQFCDKKLFLLEKDRKDPMILILLSQIEFAEKKFKDGLSHFTHLRDNYGFRFELELEQQILDILVTS